MKFLLREVKLEDQIKKQDLNHIKSNYIEVKGGK